VEQPALLVRGGRILGINAMLAETLGHSRPDLLSGLSADLLFSGEGDLVTLTTAAGSCEVERVVVDLVDPGAATALWLLRSPAETLRLQRRVRASIQALESAIDDLWSDPGRQLAREQVVRRLAGALSVEEPAESASLRDIVSDVIARVAPGVIGLSVRGEPATFVDPARLAEILGDLLRSVSDGGCRFGHIRVEDDLGGRPTMFVRVEAGPRCLDGELECQLRRRLQLLGGTLVVRESTAVLVRLPPSADPAEVRAQA
jgi:hypothetical protein